MQTRDAGPAEFEEDLKEPTRSSIHRQRVAEGARTAAVAAAIAQSRAEHRPVTLDVSVADLVELRALCDFSNANGDAQDFYADKDGVEDWRVTARALPGVSLAVGSLATGFYTPRES